jgi:hypothetical protein
MSSSKTLDWKVIGLAILGCYVLPLLLLGLVGGVFTQSDSETPIKGWSAVWLGLLWATYFLALPIVAGYVTARYARDRPQLHVFVVALVGVVLVFSISRGSPVLRLAFSVAFLAMAALGGFLVMRGRRPWK